MSLKDTPHIQRYSKGDVIVSEGIISNNAYVVLKGTVNVTKKVDNKTVRIGTLKEGEVFGEMGLISNSLRSATVVANEEVEVGVIDKERFDALVEAFPDDMKAIVSVLVERLRITTDLLTRIGLELDQTRQKLQSYILKSN